MGKARNFKFGTHIDQKEH